MGGSMQVAWMRRMLVLTCIGLFPAGMIGCGGADVPPPTRVEGSLMASEDVNPNLRGEPSPVFVRLYELRAETAFANAGFFQLYDDDSAVLGGDLQDRSDYVLRPGETVQLAKTLKPETRFLGVVAAYQDIDQATWRALVAVPPERTTAMTVALSRLDLSVEASLQDPKKRR
jgi:type VI secretion system protein VasD